MWVMTKFGFFSIVEKPEDKEKGMLTIRARVRGDLEALRHYLPQIGDIVSNAGSDYRFRVRVKKEDWAGAASKIALDIDYSNFKDKIAKAQGKSRASTYGKVWSALLDLHEPPPKAKIAPTSGEKVISKASPKANSFGGVLIDSEGRVLLRSPSNHFDGYVWTFAKGKLDPGETPEKTALREVREETGYQAEIITKIPGTFPGGTGATEFFLMRPVGKPGKFHWETEEVRWATPDEAKTLIAMTTNAVGRKRDLQVLAAAFAAHDSTFT
jgi:8-oxo-dGTP pyrophosphatase MutT (NUDIX family)